MDAETNLTKITERTAVFHVPWQDFVLVYLLLFGAGLSLCVFGLFIGFWYQGCPDFGKKNWPASFCALKQFV